MSVSENNAPTPGEKDLEDAGRMLAIMSVTRAATDEENREYVAAYFAEKRQEGRQESAELLREAREALEFAAWKLTCTPIELQVAPEIVRVTIKQATERIQTVLKKLQETEDSSSLIPKEGEITG